MPLKYNPRGSPCRSLLPKYQHVGSGNFGLRKISQDKCHPATMDKTRLKPFCNWRTVAILLLLSLIFTSLTILFCKYLFFEISRGEGERN